jgi:hypothetical protein
MLSSAQVHCWESKLRTCIVSYTSSNTDINHIKNVFTQACRRLIKFFWFNLFGYSFITHVVHTCDFAHCCSEPVQNCVCKVAQSYKGLQIIFILIMPVETKKLQELLNVPDRFIRSRPCNLAYRFRFPGEVHRVAGPRTRQGQTHCSWRSATRRPNSSNTEREWITSIKLRLKLKPLLCCKSVKETWRQGFKHS